MILSNSSQSTIADTALDTYTLNGQNYTQTGTYTQVISNSSGCDSTITLNLIINHTGINEENLFSFNLYPNPTSDKINLTTNMEISESSKIKLFNLSGALVKEIKYSEEIDVSYLNNGVYYLEITNNKIIYRKRFIKLK